MYRDADAALYQGREDGKSRIGVFKPSHDDESLTDTEFSQQSGGTASRLVHTS